MNLSIALPPILLPGQLDPQQVRLALQKRLEGRRDMNRRTAELHPDREARLVSEARAQAYECALGDLEACFTSPEKT